MKKFERTFQSLKPVTANNYELEGLGNSDEERKLFHFRVPLCAPAAYYFPHLGQFCPKS